MRKKLLTVLALLGVFASLTGCSAKGAADGNKAVAGTTKEQDVTGNKNKEKVAENVPTAQEQQVQEKKEAGPKYVFLFIGDGMSYPQFQAASDYLGACVDLDYENALPSVAYADRNGAVLDGPIKLNFMKFEAAGSAITYDSCSFAPDSASTATSVATGKKTYLREKQGYVRFFPLLSQY